MPRTLVALVVAGAISLSCASKVPSPQGPSQFEIPQLVSHVDPELPASLREQRVSGSVVIEGTIPKEGGKLRHARVVRSDDARLEPYAMAAVAQWIWSPGKLHGQPADVKYRTTVRIADGSAAPPN